VTVKLRTPDFKTATRQVTPPEVPASAEEIARLGVGLLDKFDFPAEARYRLAGVGVSNFLDEEPADEEEPSLFSD
jgi:DNA polymerase-4